MSLRNALILTIASALLAGCQRGSEIVPASGQVFYDGKPLEYGSVMFQPESGQPARATIQADGTFTLQTPGHGEGATVGHNKVRITCYESQRPQTTASEEEIAAGDSLIPLTYTDYHTSGLDIEIPEDGIDSLVIDLTDQP